MQTRLRWLDLLRGLAAIAVVVYHFHAFVGVPHTGYWFTAVDVFFALSGVVLTLKYAAPIEGALGPIEFAGARLRRLYPMVLITALFIVAMNVLHVPAGAHMLATDTEAWTVIAVTPSTSGPGAFPSDPPMWSFWAELAVNALWFLVLKAGRRWMLPVGIACMAVTIATALKMHTLNFGWEEGASFRLLSIARAMAWFSIGYWVALSRMGLKRSSAILAVVALGWVVALGALGSVNHGIHELLCAACGVALLNVLFRLPPPPSTLAAAARWLGMASFPLYLIHSPAGRLLPYLERLPHAVSFVLVIGGLTVVATWLNESATLVVQRIHRGSSLKRVGQP
jgi:peptidoglycan/LPS O-acetylase OafA/YrhL